MEPAVDGLLKVHATIAGHEGTFLFDSGSGFSNISPDFAAAIGCRPWGQITGFRMTGQRVNMQHCEKSVGVLDLSRYLPSDVGHIDGTIALDLFANEAFTLSYGGHFLRLLDKNALARTSKGLRGMPVHVLHGN